MRAGGGGVKVQRRSADSQAETAPQPVKLNGHLEMPSGLGFRASIEDGQLCIEQDRPDPDDGQLYTHSLALAKHEAARLIEWIQAQVGAVPE